MICGFFGSEYVTGAMEVISQGLSIPVLIILLVLVVVSVVLLGEVISEYFRRDKVKVGWIRDLIVDINDSSSLDEVRSVIASSRIPDDQKNVLNIICDNSQLKRSSREALARKLVEWEEEKIENKLRKTDIVTRIGPTLGLMGTLIPMGPGLAALGSGDINTLASSLTVAFNTTIIGIGSGALCYVLGKIRSGWYDRYLSDLDALSDALLDYMG